MVVVSQLAGGFAGIVIMMIITPIPSELAFMHTLLWIAFFGGAILGGQWASWLR